MAEAQDYSYAQPGPLPTTAAMVGKQDQSTVEANCGEQVLLELRGISKRFGANLVLDNVDLTVYRGEAVAIIAPPVLASQPF
jgi:phospholipid/cholesterol/gamma-HCH transport system ATP-binding protein